MADSSRSRFAVTCGDPAGCSPWLLEALLKARHSDETFLIAGPRSLRDFLADRTEIPTGSGLQWLETGSIDPEQILSGELNHATGEVAYRALQGAMKISPESLDGLLTLPLSKVVVNSAGFPDFVGHTELLEDHFDRKAVMAFFGSCLNVVVLTRHLPLRKVPESLTEQAVVSTIRTVNDHYVDRWGKVPSFAVLGLNPHAGEEGRLGNEEKDVLKPAIQTLREEGIDVDGPVPADGYLPVHGQSVDVVVACYHDQGLIPFKQRHFFDGVHATLGLPLPRVSPDHGVAADRVPDGEVDPSSTLNCLRWLRGKSPED